MKELQINVFQLFLFPVWFESFVFVGNKVSVVSEAYFLLYDLLHSPGIRLGHGGGKEDFLFGRGRQQKKMLLWRYCGD